MAMRFEYPAKIEEDSKGFYLVTFPDFPEAATDAKSREAALAEAVDCLEEAVAGRMKRGDDIPRASAFRKGMMVVALPALYAMKAALYVAMREARLSQSAVAAKLGKDEKEVRRLLDPAHASRLPAIETALRALGKKVRVSIEEDVSHGPTPDGTYSRRARRTEPV
jgi:antitoxin HicB